MDKELDLYTQDHCLKRQHVKKISFNSLFFSELLWEYSIIDVMSSVVFL